MLFCGPLTLLPLEKEPPGLPRWLLPTVLGMFGTLIPSLGLTAWLLVGTARPQTEREAPAVDVAQPRPTPDSSRSLRPGGEVATTAPGSTDPSRPTDQVAKKGQAKRPMVAATPTVSTRPPVKRPPVKIKKPIKGTPTGRCVLAATRRASFPSHSSSPVTVEYPSTLR